MNPNHFLKLLAHAMPDKWPNEFDPSAKDWSKYISQHIDKVAQVAGLGVCSEMGDYRPKDFHTAPKEKGLHKEYLFDFTLFKKWESYELPQVIIEHENNYAPGEFIFDLWKLMLGFAPLRVMFGYCQNEHEIEDRIALVRNHAQTQQWQYPTNSEDLILLGWYAMGPRDFRIFKRAGNLWTSAGSLLSFQHMADQ